VAVVAIEDANDLHHLVRDGQGDSFKVKVSTRGDKCPRLWTLCRVFGPTLDRSGVRERAQIVWK
jgi:hypothetical protein